jgi:hypothetical protein
VLIVDDQDDARWVLTNVIEQGGFVAVSAINGEDALASIRRNSPGLVLLDIGLPDLDGFEVLARIKQLDKAIPPTTPVAPCAPEPGITSPSPSRTRMCCTLCAVRWRKKQGNRRPGA